MGMACQQGTLTLLDPGSIPFWDLLMLQLLRPVSRTCRVFYRLFTLNISRCLLGDYLLSVSIRGNQERITSPNNGPDDIPAEAVEATNKVSVEVLHLIWSEEEVPSDRTRARGTLEFILLSTTGKLFNRMKLQRMITLKINTEKPR